LKVSRYWQTDLIVIGTHGRSGLSRLLLGSVAEGVVRGASVPALLIRGELRKFDLDQNCCNKQC